MASEKGKWISIMIVPEDGAGIRNWRISMRRYYMLKAGLWAVGFFLFAGVISSVALVYMYIQVYQYKQINEDLIVATSKINIITKRLSNYELRERKLRNILGEDLELPPAESIEQVERRYQLSKRSSANSFSELADLTTREESRLRRIPNIWPVDAWQITKEFKYTGNDRVDHPGIDIIAKRRSNVFATADGKVSFAGMSKRLGLRIEIDHGNGWVTEYGHNSALQVKYGDEVIKGQSIAIFGGADKSGSGPHLHYGMYYNNVPVNPLDYIKKKFELAEKE